MGLRRGLHLSIIVLFSFVLMGVAWGSTTFEWSRRFDGPAHGPDEPVGVAVDGSGNVFVTGTFTRAGEETGIATLKYDAEGKALWLKRSASAKPASASALGVDGSGNAVVAGESEGEFLTIKYDGDGNALWTRRYRSGAGYVDAARAVAVSSDGSVVVAGDSIPPGGESDFLVVKYDSDGAVVWTGRYAGPAGKADELKAMAVDGLGNVCVAGKSRNTDGAFELTTVKFDSLGAQVWADRYRGKVNGLDEAEAIAVDAERNVYVAGASTGDNGTDSIVIKLSGDGERLWTALYDGAFHGDDRAKSLAPGPLGDLYVAGWCSSGATGGDLSILRYDGNGRLMWSGRYEGAAGGPDRAVVVAVDAFGQVVVAGSALTETGGASGFITLGLETTGKPVWKKRLNVGEGGDNRPVGLALDGSTNVLVAGTSQRSGASDDYLTAKYGRKPLWEQLPFSPTEAYEVRIAVDSSGNPHLCYSEALEGDYVVRYARYDGTEWHKTILDPDGGLVEAMAIDSLDRVHVVFSMGEVTYALFDGAQWTFTQVAGQAGQVSLVVDSQNNPHICYIARGENHAVYLMYARYDGTRWITERVAEGICALEGWYGVASLAVTASGKAHMVAYLEPYPSNLYWVTNASGSWDVSLLDSGTNPCLVLDDAERLHLTYYNQVTDKLEYAWHNGSRWITTQLGDALGITSDDAYPVQLHKDDANELHVVVNLGGVGGTPLIHARKTKTGWAYDVVGWGIGRLPIASFGKTIYLAYPKDPEHDGHPNELIVIRTMR